MTRPLCLFEWRLKPKYHARWHRQSDDRWGNFCQCKTEAQAKKFGCPGHDQKKAEAFIEKCTTEEGNLFEFRWKKVEP